jgi:putative oxidoreductase
MKKFLTLTYFPAIPDLGVLALRAWFGLSLLLLHGLDKIKNWSTTMEQFKDFPSALAAAAILAESVGAGLVALGLFTRWAALGVIGTMSVAFFMAHGGKLSGPGSGEMAFLYLGAFVAVFLGGPGRYSVDALISRK